MPVLEAFKNFYFLIALDKITGQTTNNYKDAEILSVGINDEGTDLIYFKSVFGLEGGNFEVVYNINKKTFKVGVESENEVATTIEDPNASNTPENGTQQSN